MNVFSLCAIPILAVWVCFSLVGLWQRSRLNHLLWFIRKSSLEASVHNHPPYESFQVHRLTVSGFHHGFLGYIGVRMLQTVTSMFHSYHFRRGAAIASGFGMLFLLGHIRKFLNW
jgi:hypothetical protein